jgi:hypothetical protein
MRRVIPILASIALSASVGAAHANRPQGPPPLLDQCRKAFENQDYPRARDCFEQMYALVPNPAILYNMAQLERLMGDCLSASVHYRKVLDAKPSRPEHVEQATRYIEECRPAVEANPAIRFLRSIVRLD